jgi:hypothetical protein
LDFEKAPSQASKTPIKSKTMKREKGKGGRSLRQPVEETKMKRKKRGSLFFWGKSVGRPEEKKNIHALPKKIENYGHQ